MTAPAVHQLTCKCGWIMAVHDGAANCPTCKVVYHVLIGARPMTPAEQRIAAAHLRGERLPAEEPTVTAKENLS